MADEEQKKGGTVAAFMGGGALTVSNEEMAAALLESASTGTTGDGDAKYLSFSGQGANYAGWKLGRDKEKPSEDAVYIVDPQSAVEGWTCWKGGSVAEKHEWSVYQRAQNGIPASGLTDHGPYGDGDGWQFMMGISMFDVDEPLGKITFSTTSKSGRNALGDLTKEVATRAINNEPKVPVITLGDEMFEAQGKKNGKPRFDIEGWVTEAEVMAFMEAGDEGDLDALLEGKYGAAEEAEAEEEPAPKKRRGARRAAA